MAKRRSTASAKKVREPTLRDLSYATISTDELATVLKEAETGPDRYAAIIIATVLEGALDQLIFQKLKVFDRKIIAGLYEESGPMSNFSSKIKLGFVLKLFDEITRDNLDCIRRIRNAYAHAQVHLLFTTPQIVKECEKLKIPLTYPKEITSRELYIKYSVDVMVRFNKQVANSILRGQQRLKRQVAELDKSERPVMSDRLSSSSSP
jgi:DNA-binding MltR family transcriptional regulator